MDMKDTVTIHTRLCGQAINVMTSLATDLFEQGDREGSDELQILDDEVRESAGFGPKI